MELAELDVEGVALVGGAEAVQPAAGGGERDGVADLAGLDPDRDGEVGLAQAGWAEQDGVLPPADEGGGGQVRDGVAGRGGQLGEGEVLQRLGLREVRPGDA